MSSPEGALEHYWSIQARGLKPSTPLILSALKACAALGNIQAGARIHEQLRQIHHPRSPVSNIFIANSLLDMYAKCGSLPGAEQIFQSMPHRSLVSWNSIILAYANSNSRSDSALRAFYQMQEFGFVPDSRSFVAVLKSLSSDEESDKELLLEKCRAVHSQLLNLGLQTNKFVSSSLLDAYSKLGSMSEAREVFDSTQSHDSISWNSLMLGYVQRNQGVEALELFSRMHAGDSPPDARSFVAAIAASSSEAENEPSCKLPSGELVRVLNLERGMVLDSRAKLLNLSDAFVSSSLVDLYSKCGSLADASRVFARMPEPDVVSWNALILAYAQAGRGELALETFSRQELPPNARSFGAALKACSSLAESEQPDERLLVKIASLEKGMALHGELRRRGIESDLFVASALLDLYSKAGSMADASRVFRGLATPDSVCWSAMISGHVQSHEHELALELFWRMRSELDQEPDPGAVAAAIRACGSLAALEPGETIHSIVRSSEKLSSDIHVANSLISFYGRCGRMDESQRVFDSMEGRRRDLISWSSLIAGYSQRGDAEAVFRLFDSMRKEERIQVDGVTFLSILTLCCRAGLVEEGREYFRAMWCDHGIPAGIEHFTCMVDLLGKANYLDEALGLLRSMPFPGDATIYTVLLDACSKWRNVEVGRIAFEELVRLGEHQPAAYVLMANTYADAGMGDESGTRTRL